MEEHTCEAKLPHIKRKCGKKIKNIGTKTAYRVDERTVVVVDDVTGTVVVVDTTERTVVVVDGVTGTVVVVDTTGKRPQLVFAHAALDEDSTGDQHH